MALEETDIAKLTTAEETLLAMGGYGDIANVAEKCRQRIDTLAEQANSAENDTPAPAPAEPKDPLRKKRRHQPIAEKTENRTKKRGFVAALSVVAVLLVAFIVILSLQVLKKSRYAAAETQLREGNIAEATIAFGALGDYSDAKQRSMELWDETAERHTISVGEHSFAVKRDGTVVTTGNYAHDRYDVSDWSGLVALSAVYEHTVGLKSDGTVVAVGLNDHGECDVSAWTEIVAVSAGLLHTVGLKSESTVVATGSNDVGQCVVSGWTDIRIPE